MDKLMELIEQHPELKEAYDKLVEIKGKLSKEDIVAFLKEHDIDLPDLPDLDELKDKAEDLLGGGKEGIADAIKGIGGLFGKK